jgi:low temperature requirement protein LtrA
VTEPAPAGLRGPVIRDPDEEHRASTPLELFFDLCFVVGVAQVTLALAHALASEHLLIDLAVCGMVFVAVWWAWMNFTWFAAAHDSDDVPYRLLTLLQMAGVLVLAAGVPAATGEVKDFRTIVVGYVIMRLGLIGCWLRVARALPEVRTRALRYATGVAVLQVCWIALALSVTGPGYLLGWAPLMLLELAVPAWSDGGQPVERWNREHIAERYGLFALLILGESILAVTLAVQAAAEAGPGTDLFLASAAGLLIAFGCWWLYYDALGGRWPAGYRAAFLRGYGHLLVFAALAALGGALEVVVGYVSEKDHGHVSARIAALAVTLAVAVFLLAVAGLARQHAGPVGGMPVWLVAAALLGLIGAAAAPATAALGTGVVLAVLVAVVVRARDRVVGAGS